MSSIALLINSKAGKGKALKFSVVLQNKLTERNLSFQYFIDNWPEQISNYSEVWIIGGDGTLNFFINKYPDCIIPMVIFKGGTGNDIAWKLYGDISIEEQFDLIFKATGKYVDAGICNNRLFINGIGVGFDGEVLKSISAVRWIGGHLGYLLVVIKKILSFKEHHFSISIDGKKIEGRLLLTMLFNSSRTGGGFHVAPTAEINDGMLNLVLCKPLAIFKRLIYLPIIEKGRHLNRSFIEHVTGNNFLIECDEPLPAQIDGELICAQSYEVAILPNKFIFKY